MDEDTPIGERIAYWRTQRKMSQAVLAGQVERSESWLQKIEYGERAMDSIAMLEKLAHVLKVKVWDLKPKLGLPPNGDDAHASRLRIDAIRDALFATPRQDADAVDLAALRATAEQASRLRTNGHYRPVAVLLPDLLIAARAATAQDMPEAWLGLARAYQVAVDLIREVGERELALLIADRYVGAGQRSGDGLLMATSRLRSAGWRAARYGRGGVLGRGRRDHTD